MSDLVCTRCGVSTSYADASNPIVDQFDDCDHNWVEPLHDEIDVV